MEKQDIQTIITLRSKLIAEYAKLRDYKNNKNAIMKEVDCARILDFAIREIDSLLAGKVEFK